MPDAIGDTNASTLEALGLSRKPEVKEKEELGMDDFLELMVAELNNQDPTKPMDSQQFLGQIAQFTAVSGIDEMNTTLTSLTGSLTSSQGLEASTLLGREVYIESDQAALGAGGVIKGSVELKGSTADLVVQVSNLSGQLVKELHLGPQPSGTSHFSWDGLDESGEFAGDGQYKIDVVSVSGDQSIGLEPLLAARVDSVVLGQGGQPPTLNLAGQGSIAFDLVRQIN